MRWCGIAMVAMAACGPKAAEPLEPPSQIAPAKRVTGAYLPYGVIAPRPAIDVSPYLPDFHHELRWPLSGMAHPSLEPRFPIASVFAAPGVGWHELCARGVHLRTSATQKEQLAYLRGWCAAAARDVDAACKHLVPLIGSVVPGLTAAVRSDLASILVDHGGADKAEHYLTRHLVRDVAVLDLLAANYVEVGMEGDAFEINRRAMDADSYATQATKCRRLAKHIVLRDAAMELGPMKHLESLATTKAPDPVCAELYDKIRCWKRPASDCALFLRTRGVDPRAQAVLAVYLEWPTRADAWTWLDLATRLTEVASLPGAEALMLTAFAAAARARPSECSDNRRVWLHHALDVLHRTSPQLRQLPDVIAIAEACPPRVLPAGTTVAPATFTPSP